MEKMAKEYMQAAIEEAMQGIENHHGGPFGSVIVRDGEIVGRGHNRVLIDRDPTCHGGVAAMRDACRRLYTHDLSGCILYTTGEPCPMCLFACRWANIEKVIYGCTIEDNAKIGFRDREFDSMVDRSQMEGFLVNEDREACQDLFRVYSEGEHDTY